MTDYTPQPIVIREVNGLTISQSGDQANVNGSPARMVLASEITGNAQHYLRAPLKSVMARLSSGDVAAVVIAEVSGKSAQILITAEQFAAGKPERARYAAWSRGVMTVNADRQDAERRYDLVNNEGGEGYNPHRSGGERTYARNIGRDRRYPEGA